MVGQTISHYKVLDKLGEGGMGVVYKAEDTALDRPVALKFLPTHLLGNEDVRKRFEREAKSAAALDHPNVCHVHEIDEADGKTFISMSLIEGESLDKKIARGPLKLDEALSIAHQVAKGLEAAHKRGIVHRDIKPENIMVGEDGHVTIMDFGLAQLTEASRLTRTDETVGTVAYMSPEQTEGSGTDHRTDIWSLGVVLYEIVTGQQPFKGDYDKAVIYSILNEEPEPITALRTGVPMELEVFVGKCLAKQAANRYDSAGDVAKDIRGLVQKQESGRSALRPTPVGAASAAHQGSNDRRYQAALCFLGLICLTMAALYFNRPAARQAVRRFTVTPTGPVDVSTSRTSLAISPNGKHIVYATAGTDGRLWIQGIDQFEPRPLEGTASAESPFWSPDSRYIAFRSGDAELRKIPVEGGLSSFLCTLPTLSFNGGAWSPDGKSIVFGSSDGIYEVPSQGGAATLVVGSKPTASDTADVLARPHFLPPEAGERVLFYTIGPPTERSMVVRDLDSGRQTVLGPGTHAYYSSSGHLIYQAGLASHDLWALPFSLDDLEASGEPFPIARAGRGPTVASDQTLVYLDSSLETSRQLVWRNRAGEMVGKIGQPQPGLSQPALSPNGRYVAVAASSAGSPADIWVHEVERATMRRLTLDGAIDLRPNWSPDGRRIVFASDRTGNYDMYLRSADGTGEAELLYGTGATEPPVDWSRDGKYILFTSRGTAVSFDIWYLRRDGDSDQFEPVEFLSTAANETVPKLSPDGRFLAYCSDISRDYQVYVRPFPSGEGQWQVSERGGCQPRWSRDGKELFFVEGDALMAAEVTVSPSLSTRQARRLFANQNLVVENPNEVSYDVSDDGRFVMTYATDDANEGTPMIRVVENWYEEFRGRE